MCAFSNPYTIQKESIKQSVLAILSLYKQMDNYLYIDEQKINLNKEKVKRISILYDADFYFNFFNAVAKYRENLKQIIANNPFDNKYMLESRIKNINSISSKIYQYINIKSEKGEVPISKCLNDLYGARIIISHITFKRAMKMVNEIAEESGINCRIINASKMKYRAIHMYLKGDPCSIRWEIQFWLACDDKKNRESHAQYKQMYTKWESRYKKKELYKEI